MSLFDQYGGAPPPPPKVNGVPDAAPTPATPAPTTEPTPDPNAWKKLLKTKDGKIDSTPSNVTVLLHFHSDFRGRIKWNAYAKKMEVRGGVFVRYEQCAPDAIATATQDILMQLHGVSVSHSDVARRLFLIAQENTYNPLVDWLNSLQWDGVPRLDGLFITYFGAGKIAGKEPTPEEAQLIAHLRRISRCWALGAVERAYRPGSKVDNIIVLEGPQGQKKTSAIRALGGDFYCSTAITLGDKDSKMVAASAWFVDLPDTNFMKSKNKGFITTATDFFRPPYGSAMINTPRSCIFIASINPDGSGYFDDMTGNRRYWPISCDAIDIAGLMRDRDQIWAEAVHLMKASESCADCAASTDTVPGQKPKCARHRWWLDETEEKFAAKIVGEREEDIPWKLRIHQWWLSMAPVDRPSSFSVEDVATKALGMDQETFARNDRSLETSIGMAVRSLGFNKARITVNGHQFWAYKPNSELAAAPQVKKASRSWLDGTDLKIVR